jgi:aminopeptidase N
VEADLTLVSLHLNGELLPASAWQKSGNGDRIIIAAAVLTAGGEQPRLSIVTSFNPTANLALEGLYVTNGTFCTQCEAEGFRRIYFPDRPDVLSEYQVTIRASRDDFPVLLSNGNLVSERDLGDGRHEAVWHDPHKKPCYLFALVAGKIDRLQDHHDGLGAQGATRDLLDHRQPAALHLGNGVPESCHALG